MSSFHVLFSLGGLVGAVGAGLAMSLGVRTLQHVLIITSISLLSVLFALFWLLPTESQQRKTDLTFVKPTGALFGLGILAFFGLLAEGSMADWSAVYLNHTLNTSSSIAAIGFAAFSGAMAIGRFSGDFLVNRFGPTRLLRVSGTVAAVGLGLGLLVGEPVAAILGFGL